MKTMLRIATVRAAALASFVLACAGLALGMSACADNNRLPDRAAILSADGAVLAEMQDVSGRYGWRTYPTGSVAAPVVGSLYTEEALPGIEQTYEEDLLAGNDVVLTLDSRIQQLAFDALGNLRGSAVVLDPETGAVRALVSTPTYDPMLTEAESDLLANRATELHVPGSIFKTITLAAALENGVAELDTYFQAASSLTFEGGSVTNYDTMQYPDQTLLEAYAKSINTVFAQLSLFVGEERLQAMARNFGFDAELATDIPCKVSTIYDVGEMSTLMQAWTGVGQALYQPSGRLQGPVMSAIHGAAIAGCIANGGTLYAPYLVQQVGEGIEHTGENAVDSSGALVPDSQPASAGGTTQPRILSQGFLSDATLQGLTEAMEQVVRVGTGTRAAVSGVQVCGKTGTAETADGADDGWFMGFARAGSQSYAVCVLVGNSASAEACEVAHTIIEGLF